MGRALVMVGLCFGNGRGVLWLVVGGFYTKVCLCVWGVGGLYCNRTSFGSVWVGVGLAWANTLLQELPTYLDPRVPK